MLAPDVRLEGFTAEDWTRLLGLFKPEAPPDPNALGGLFVIHDGGAIRKMLHTRRGRLEREGEWKSWPDLAEPERVKRLAALAEAQQASWIVAAEVGALEEVMERFGERAKRQDDLTAQALTLLGIVREMMNASRIEGWPRRLKNIPVPTLPMIRRALDATCKEDEAIALGIFKDGALWTALVLRRTARGFDLIAGPDDLRPAMGLLSGEWRRDVRHLVAAVEDRYAPLSLGCFGEIETLSALQMDGRAGAWSRAIAMREVIISPMPLSIGVAIGIDSARYAWGALPSMKGPLALFEPVIQALRKRVGGATDKDIASVLGFSPLEVLRALKRDDDPAK